eukprot:6490062-Amphidinium_carterae.1
MPWLQDLPYTRVVAGAKVSVQKKKNNSTYLYTLRIDGASKLQIDAKVAGSLDFMIKILEQFKAGAVK